MPEDKQPKSETSNKGTSAKSDTTARVVKTIPEGYKKEVRDGKTVYVLKKEVPGGNGERPSTDTTGNKTVNPPRVIKKASTSTSSKATTPNKPKAPVTTTTPPTKKSTPKPEPAKTYTEDILTLEEPVTPVKAPVARELKGEANIYRRINNAESDVNQTTYDYPDEFGNYTNKAIKRTFVGDKEVDKNTPMFDEKGNFKPSFIQGSNLNQGANVGGLTNYIMPGDASANTNVEGFKGNLGSAGFGVTKNATGGLGVTNYTNTPSTFVPPTYDAKGNKIGGGIITNNVEAAKVNAIPGSAGTFNLQGDVTPEAITPTVPVPPIEKKAKGGVVGYVDGGIVAYNANGQGIDRYGKVVPKQEYGVEQAGSAVLGALPGIASGLTSKTPGQTPTTGATPTTPQNPSAPTTGAAGAAGAAKSAGMSAGTAGAIAGVGSLAAGIGASAIDSKNKDARGRYTSTEAAVGSSALKGAGMGAQMGMAAGPQGALIGAGIGAVAGAGYGLYKGDKDKKAIDTSNKKMASELATANTKTQQQRAMADRDAGVENRTSANLITKDQAMYDENDNLINPVQYAAKGGTIVGKGGPKSDSILTNSKNGIKPGSFIVPAENNSKAKVIRKAVLGDNPNEMANFKKGGETDSDIAVSNGEHLFTPSERKKIVSYLGQEILEELAPNAENGNDKASGGMIKRADGSYSKRGLWDNIRANAGSGKEPTKEMLKQERKIKSEMSQGGLLGTLTDRENMREYKKGGKVMAPKMMYADGTPPDGVNSEEEKAKIKAEEEAVKAKEDAIEKGKKDYESRYNAAKKIVAAQNDRKGKISSYDKRLKEAEAKLNALEKSYKDYSAEKEIIKGQKQPETVWGMKTEANPEKIREDKKKMLADLESARKEYNSVKQVYDFVKDDKNYDANTGEMKSKTAPKVTAKVNPPVTTAPPTDAATTGSTTTRGVVKGSGVKAPAVPKSVKFVPKMAEPGEGDDVVVPGDNLSPNERAAMTAKEKLDSENAKKLSDSAIAAGTSTPTPTTPPPATQSKLAQALSGVNTEALIGAGQSALGYNMLKGEKRPGYKFELDPAYQASVERQKQEAGYGLSAEQRAMANQDIANALSDTRYSARNFAGGNAGTAFGQETMAINEGWRNKLGLISKDQELKMAKQQISDQSIKERAGIMTGAKRQAYEDAMGRFQQIQQAGSELVGAGIRNVIGSTRLNKELEAMKAAKAQQDAYLGTVGTA